MKIGKLSNNQLPNLKIRACCQDIIRKSESINYKLDVIQTMNSEIENNDFYISERDKIILAGEISDCLEKMYSCMEYVATIFSQLYKGGVSSQYHKLLTKTLTNKDSSSVYADNTLVDFVDRSYEWYSVVHDIRSEETHYSSGRILVENNKILYKISRQTNRKTVGDLINNNEKLKGEDKEEYTLEVIELIKIYLNFISSINQLEIILLEMS